MLTLILLLFIYQFDVVFLETVPHFDLENVCGTLGFKQSLYFNKKPVIFKYKSQEKLTCHLELHLRKREMGFYIFIERLKVETTPECVTDFLQFGRDNFVFTSFVSDKFCEKIEYVDEVLDQENKLTRYDFKNTSLEGREYIENVDNEMDIWLRIGSSHGREKKEVVLLVVPFEKYCAPEDLFYRSCHSNSIDCFEKELFCDKIIKCDIMDQNEQSSCEHDMKARILPIAFIIFLSVLSTILAIFIVSCTITVCFRIIKHKQNHRAEGEALEEIEGSSHAQNVNQIIPHSEVLGFEPEYTSNPPTYEEVMGSRIKDSPPPNYSQID